LQIRLFLQLFVRWPDYDYSQNHPAELIAQLIDSEVSCHKSLFGQHFHAVAFQAYRDTPALQAAVGMVGCGGVRRRSERYEAIKTPAGSA